MVIVSFIVVLVVVLVVVNRGGIAPINQYQFSQLLAEKNVRKPGSWGVLGILGVGRASLDAIGLGRHDSASSIDSIW